MRIRILTSYNFYVSIYNGKKIIIYIDKFFIIIYTYILIEAYNYIE